MMARLQWIALAVCFFGAVQPAAAAAVGLPRLQSVAQAGQQPIVLVQGRRDDPSRPIVQTPNRRRGGSLFNDTPFASPTAPVFPRRQGPVIRTAPSPDATTPPGSDDTAEGEDVANGVPEAQSVPPYEKELVRLAELLGSLHYLRTLCGAQEGGLWRDEMERLVAAEPDNAVWRARLKQSFNMGYSGFDRTYQSCTPSAARAAGLFLEEGKTLIASIKTRYAY